jgi:predicted anti-sigma-YlaC factor YlaD
MIERDDYRGQASNVKTQPSENECAEFQALMPERIGAGEDLMTYEHMQMCERCPALLRDLEAIAEAAAIFMKMRDEEESEPPDKVWIQIQQALKQEEA